MMSEHDAGSEGDPRPESAAVPVRLTRLRGSLKVSPSTFHGLLACF